MKIFLAIVLTTSLLLGSDMGSSAAASVGACAASSAVVSVDDSCVSKSAAMGSIVAVVNARTLALERIREMVELSLTTIVPERFQKTFLDYDVKDAPNLKED